MKDKELMSKLKENCEGCEGWSGTDCTRNPYTEGCLKEQEKQIEEMAVELMQAVGDWLDRSRARSIMSILLVSGWVKLSEDRVVLSKEEYESLKNEPVSIFKNYQEMVKFYGGEVRNLKAENEELKNQLTKERKEMAEKFYDLVKEKIEQIEKFYFDNGKIGYNGLTVRELKELVKQLGVEV